MPSPVLLAQMNREQVRRIAPEATVVLPIGSTEQHGPHLPLDTDAAACTAICQRAAEMASREIPIVVAPTLPFAYSHVHRPHPGVLSLAPATLLKVLRELGEGLFQSGFRRIAFINGHGATNDDIVRVAAADLAEAVPASTAAAAYWTIAHEAMVQQFGIEGLHRLPGHAGTYETALMLALRPELVDSTPLPPGGGEDLTPLPLKMPSIRLAGKRYGFGHGYTDQPSAATAEAGRLYLETTIRAVAAFLVDFHRQHPES